MPFGLPSDWQLLPGFIPNMTGLLGQFVQNIPFGPMKERY